MKKFLSSIKEVSEKIYDEIGCIEEIAYLNKFIDEEQLLKIANLYKNDYGDYLRSIIIRKNWNYKISLN